MGSFYLLNRDGYTDSCLDRNEQAQDCQYGRKGSLAGEVEDAICVLHWLPPCAITGGFAHSSMIDKLGEVTSLNIVSQNNPYFFRIDM